jgi:hypothetical protein
MSIESISHIIDFEAFVAVPVIPRIQIRPRVSLSEADRCK